MQFARRLVGTQTLKDWDMQLTHRLLPECAKHGNYTQAYLECHVRHITLPGMAPVGTCRIGAAADPAAVVDPLLRSAQLLRHRASQPTLICAYCYIEIRTRAHSINTSSSSAVAD